MPNPNNNHYTIEEISKQNESLRAENKKLNTRIEQLEDDNDTNDRLLEQKEEEARDANNQITNLKATLDNFGLLHSQQQDQIIELKDQIVRLQKALEVAAVDAAAKNTLVTRLVFELYEAKDFITHTTGAGYQEQKG